jgi:copper(I)-binding protein
VICTQAFAGHHQSHNSSHSGVVIDHAKPTGYKLAISHATVRTVLPGKSITAAFFTLANPSQSDCTLLSAESPSAERIEFHTHQHQGDMVRMRALDQVKVPAGESLVFKSGGLHLMLFGVDPAINSDGVTQLTLHTDQCGSVTAPASFIDMMAASKHGAVH